MTANESAERHDAHTAHPHRPSLPQRIWLVRGVDQPGGKLPLFDRDGQRVDVQTVRSCIQAGWAEPWFCNPLKPDWLVCKLTETGRKALADNDEA
jgi:hypothetical protein